MKGYIMKDREEFKKELEDSGNAMWALSDIFFEIDKVYDEIGSCSRCKYWDGELCKEHHGFTDKNFFCADFEKANK